MQNCRSRVQELKLEIDQISRKININPLSIPDTLGQQQLFDKNREKAELEKQLQTLKSSTKQKKDSYQAELITITKKLQSLLLKKQSTHKNKSSRIKYLNQISHIEEDLKKATEDFSVYTEKLSRNQKLKFNAILANQLSYEQTLSPVESELKMISFKHNNLLEKLAHLQSEVLRLENISEMTKEDIFSLSVTRSELIMQREDLETQIEIMEFEFCDELEYNQEEDEFILNMIRLKKIMDPICKQINGLEASLNALDFNISNTKQKIVCINKEYANMCTASPGFEDIKNVEDMIKEKCKSFNTDFIEEIIVNVNAVEGFDIDEEILRIQFREIEKAEDQIRKVWNLEEKEFIERIKIQKIANQLTNDAENELKFKKKQYKNRIAAINQ